MKNNARNMKFGRSAMKAVSKAFKASKSFFKKMINSDSSASLKSTISDSSYEFRVRK